MKTYSTLWRVAGALMLVMLIAPARAEAKRPKSVAKLVDAALAATISNGVKAYQKLLYLPSHGLKYCPALAKTRGWTTQDIRKDDEKYRTSVRSALAKCATMGDWRKAKQISVWGGFSARRMPECKGHAVYTIKRVKALYKLGSDYVEVALRAIGRVDGRYGMIQAPTCRQRKASYVEASPELRLGKACTLQAPGRTRSKQGWRPSPHHRDRNRVLGRHDVCSQSGTIAGIYAGIHRGLQRSYRDLLLEDTKVGPMPGYDQRTISLRGDTLMVRYHDCVRCAGYAGWSFLGRLSLLTKSELLELQRALGIPAKVGPLKTPAAWRKHYKK